MKNRIKIAIIGCGNIARSIINGLNTPAAKAALKANGDIFEVTVTDRDEAKLIPVKPLCRVSLDNSAAAAADYVILAVKPHDAQSAVSGVDLSDKTVISVMAGVTIQKIKELTRANRVVRAMPNVNARVGEAYVAFCCEGLSDEDRRVAIELLASSGRVSEVEEKYMSAVTGISGSGAAFVFMAMKAFYDESIACGFSSEQAKDMAVSLFIGSAINAENYDGSFDSLIQSVCSKGGTTVAGVDYLEESGFENILRSAVKKSIARAEELQ